MEENDIITLKAIAALLEYMAAGTTDVYYTAESLGMLSGQLMDMVKKLDDKKNYDK